MKNIVVGLAMVCVLSLASCSQSTSSNNSAAKPGKSFTAADIEKIKWLQGTWRGMDGDKPFYESYKFEGTTMIVQGIKEDFSNDGEPGRYELLNGEFGKGEGDKRTAASEITADYIQFVPAIAGKSNNYRFTHLPNGNWQALLEWQAAGNKPAGNKIYTMEPWPLKK